MAAKKIVRYVVPGVVNERVVIEEVTYEERDGTGDVYAKIYLKASPALEAITTESGNAGAGTGSAANSTGRSDPESGPAHPDLHRGGRGLPGR